MTDGVTIVGGGLAGVEAAWRCARAGVAVRLYEMRPAVTTPAHRTALLGELVCSNSLKSEVPGTAAALLKEEMRGLGSLVLEAAAATRVRAGGALAVDREGFARRVTAVLEESAGIEVVREEVKTVPGPVAVVATGPLTAEPLAAALEEVIGCGRLFFYDALAPIVAAASINYGQTFEASRYGKGDGGYVNCPLTREEYYGFVDALAAAQTATLREFEAGLFFEACLPVEELARRGRDTLRFGPFKPVGLNEPGSGRHPFAALQLRREDAAGRMLGLVGCQTRLTVPEQQRVFRNIPALERAEFLRFGAAHRNTYIASPGVLAPTMELKPRPGVFLAGQLVGVEGYVESAATGILAGLNAGRLADGLRPVYPPRETALGALVRYTATAPLSTFTPMNFNYGLLPVVAGGGRETRRALFVERARAAFGSWLEEVSA